MPGAGSPADHPVIHEGAIATKNFDADIAAFCGCVRCCSLRRTWFSCCHTLFRPGIAAYDFIRRNNTDATLSSTSVTLRSPVDRRRSRTSRGFAPCFLHLRNSHEKFAVLRRYRLSRGSRGRILSPRATDGRQAADGTHDGWRPRAVHLAARSRFSAPSLAKKKVGSRHLTSAAFHWNHGSAFDAETEVSPVTGMIDCRITSEESEGNEPGTVYWPSSTVHGHVAAYLAGGARDNMELPPS